MFLVVGIRLSDTPEQLTRSVVRFPPVPDWVRWCIFGRKIVSSKFDKASNIQVYVIFKVFGQHLFSNFRWSPRVGRACNMLAERYTQIDTVTGWVVWHWKRFTIKCVWWWQSQDLAIFCLAVFEGLYGGMEVRGGELKGGEGFRSFGGILLRFRQDFVAFFGGYFCMELWNK